MSGKIRTNPLFVGLTRPAMLFGVSYSFCILNGLVCMMFFIFTSKFQYIALMFPIHGLGFYLCSKEPLFIDLFIIKSSKCSKCKNKFYHGANTYDPY